jgi:hypothetical protein
MNYISLGYECSTASILRELGLRKFALPFDWIRTSPLGIYYCISDNFMQFHKILHLATSKGYIIDEYGFEYPHDYPTTSNMASLPGEGDMDEAIIKCGWETYHGTVLEKYERRIERFHAILRSSEPIIALFFGNTSDIYMFKAAFLEVYHKKNIVYVVNSHVPSMSEDVVVCDGSKDGWLSAIKEAENRSKHLNGLP